MADAETEKWAEKTRQIEKERLKATRAATEEDQKFSKANSAYLDAREKKIYGWSSDHHLLLAQTEKLGTWSAILAPAGVVMEIIANAGVVVTQTNSLGLAGATISGLPGALAGICFLAAVLFAALVVCVELYCKIRDDHKFGMGWWSALGSMAVLLIYALAMELIA